MALPTSNSTLSEEFLNENRGWVLITESVIMAVLTTGVLALRFYARRFRTAKSGLEDWLIVAAYIMNLGMCAIGIVMTQVAGVGQHAVALEQRNPALIVGWAKCILAFTFIYFPSVALPKLAIISLCMRVFNWTGGMRVAALALGGLVIAMSVSLTICLCFQCVPLAYWWDRSIPGGQCIDVQKYYHAQAIPGSVLGFMIMALPARTIWSLKMPTNKRIGLLMIFIVASLGVVASIIRTVTFFGVAALADETFASVQLVGWSIIETGAYIVTACLPHLRPVISHYTPKWIKDKLRRTFSGFNSQSWSRSRHGGYGNDKLRMHTHTTGDSKTIGQDDDAVQLTKASASEVDSQNVPQYYEPAGVEAAICPAKTADFLGEERWRESREESRSGYTGGNGGNGAIMVTKEEKMETASLASRESRVP